MVNYLVSLMIRLHCIVLHTITLWLLVTFLTGVEKFVGGKFA